MQKTTTDFSQFVRWELSAEVIDFKRAYVDMTAEPGNPLTGDTLAGLLLSQIVYHHLPNRRAKKEHQLDVEREGYWWLVRKRTEWWRECRIKPNRFDRLITLLQDRGLVVVKLWKFGGVPTHHIRLDYPIFMARWDQVINDYPVTTIHNPSLPKTADPILANGENGILADHENRMILANGENGILADHENPMILANGENDLIKEKIKKGDLIIVSDDRFSGCWVDTLKELETQMTSATFNTWFKDSRFRAVCISPDGVTPPHGVWVIGVRNDYARDWLVNRLSEMILRTLADVLAYEGLLVDVPLQLHVVVDGGANKPPLKTAKVLHNKPKPIPPTENNPPGVYHDPDYQELAI